MTREQLFTTTFEPQFELATPFKSLIRNQTSAPAKNRTGESRATAPSDYPCYEIIPGDARYTSYDSFGSPVTGVQRFTLHIVFAFPQLALDTMRSVRSDYVSTIEWFFSGAYTPP